MSIDKNMSSNKKLLSLVNLVKLFVSCIQKCYPSKNFRGSAPNPAGGLNTPQTPTCKAPPFTAGYAPACLAMVVSEFRLSTFVLGGLRGFTATSDLVCNDCTINQFHVHSVPIISFFFFFFFFADTARLLSTPLPTTTDNNCNCHSNAIPSLLGIAFAVLLAIVLLISLIKYLKDRASQSTKRERILKKF